MTQSDQSITCNRRMAWHRWKVVAHNLADSKRLDVRYFVSGRRCDRLVRRLVAARLRAGDQYPLYTREPVR